MRFAKLRKWLRRTMWCCLLLLLAAGVFVVFIEEVCEFSPPAVKDAWQKIGMLGKQQEQSGWESLGECWRKEEMGILMLASKGEPFVRGWASARLTRSHFSAFEHAIWQQLQPFRSNHPYQFWLARKGVYLFFYDLPCHFPASLQEEVAGFAGGMDNNYPELGSTYFRALHYQAAYDHLEHSADLLAQGHGGTSFATWGKATRNGHLWLGRNFDCGLPDIFETYRLLQIVHPHQGIPFVSISWPGMSGVVSGVNRERLAVFVHGATNAHRAWKGTPVTVLARRILQEAATIQAAVDILRNSASGVSQSFLLADGKTGRSVVVEKSPQLMVVRMPQAADTAIECVNHFQAVEFADVNKQPQSGIEESGSPRRLARLQELLRRHRGNIDAGVAVAILRDYKALGDVAIGTGHRHTINPGIATHSLVLDLSEGVLWLARGPRLCGQYLPLPLATLWQHDASRTFVNTSRIVPADSQFGEKQLKQLKTWHEHIEQWLQKPEDVSKIIGILQSLNGDHFLTMVATGDFYFYQNKHARAREWWLKGFNHYPYGGWQESIKKRIDSLPK